MNSRTRLLLRCLHAGMIFVPLMTIAFLPGCSTQSDFSPTANYYYLNPNTDITSIGRVAVVELNNDSSYPQMSSDVTDSLFQALQKKQVFGLTIIRQNDPAYRSLQLEPDLTYSLDQIQSIRETTKCDGILLGTITEFRPYPHMTIGLRLKLLDLRNGHLVWALEQVWDITDRNTGYRVRRYYKSEKGSGSTQLQEKLASSSPFEFIKFVSYEVAETL